jgi:ABC-2 type transport system ATP-binding protein
MNHVISTDNLSKTFNGVQALTALNMDVPRHAIVGFLGPNGAGKTTAIRLLLGLIRPTVGSASIFGLDSVRDSVHIRRRVGYLAQQPRFYEYMTVRETLELTAQLFFTEAASSRNKRVDEALVLVDLVGKADRKVKGLSGGELQRLGIAQAQINEPELLILDEPVAALDPMGRLAMLNIMESLRDRATIFFSTHILDDVQRISDHVIILNRGELVAQGPIETLLNNGSQPTYHVTIAGDMQTVAERIKQQAWVSQIHEQTINGLHHWQVTVSDDDCARRDLLRLILKDDGVQVLKFGQDSAELEDVFMQLVNGEQSQ